MKFLTLEKLKDRDIAVIKQFFQMYCELINQNIDDNVEALPRLWLNKTIYFLMKFVQFLDKSELCSESVYWNQCTDVDKHRHNVYTCVNFENCMMITNCSELAKYHFNYSPTVESAQNHPVVNSVEHYGERCSGIGFVNHYY